jgi:hypothetical protein
MVEKEEVQGPIEKPTDGVAEPVAEPTVEPVAEPAAEPTTEPAAKAAAEPTTEPAAKAAAEPVAEPATEPVAEPAAEPAAEPVPGKKKSKKAVIREAIDASPEGISADDIVTRIMDEGLATEEEMEKTRHYVVMSISHLRKAGKGIELRDGKYVLTGDQSG